MEKLHAESIHAEGENHDFTVFQIPPPEGLADTGAPEGWGDLTGGAAIASGFGAEFAFVGSPGF